MFKAKQKSNLIIWLTVLVVGMMLFSFVGTAIAYFQIEKNITGTFKVGVVSADWYNGTTKLTAENPYQLCIDTQNAPLNKKLVAGDSAGAYVTKVDGSAGGDIRIQASSSSAGQYVRVKFSAMIAETDVSQYLTFSYIDDENDINFEFGTYDFWRDGEDGWYYFVDGDTNILSASNYVMLFNNIKLSGSFPGALRGKVIDITFTYETIQSANNAVGSVWGVDFLSV